MTTSSPTDRILAAIAVTGMEAVTNFLKVGGIGAGTRRVKFLDMDVELSVTIQPYDSPDAPRLLAAPSPAPTPA